MLGCGVARVAQEALYNAQGCTSRYELGSEGVAEGVPLKQGDASHSTCLMKGAPAHCVREPQPAGLRKDPLLRPADMAAQNVYSSCIEGDLSVFTSLRRTQVIAPCVSLYP